MSSLVSVVSPSCISILCYHHHHHHYQDHDKLQASKLLGSNKGKESPPKSRYIKNLQQSAKVRDINNQRAFDRKLLKERSAEDAEFGEKEAFITTAYQQKLDIEKRWEYEVGKMMT